MRLKSTWFSREWEFTPEELEKLYCMIPTKIRNKILSFFGLSWNDIEDDTNEKN